MTDPLITDEAAELNWLHADLMFAAEENRGFNLTKRQVVLLAGWFADHEECDERAGYDQGRADATETIVAAMESWFPDPHEGGRDECSDCWLIRKLVPVVREVGPKTPEETNHG